MVRSTNQITSDLQADETGSSDNQNAHGVAGRLAREFESLLPSVPPAAEALRERELPTDAQLRYRLVWFSLAALA